MDNLPLKRCSTCHEFKTLDNFAKDKSRKDGHSWRCRTCHASMNRRYQGKNNEIKAQRANQRYHANKDEINARARANRAANPEKHREYQRNWRLKNLERVRAKARDWRRNNPERLVDSTRANKNRRRGAKVENYTIQQALDLYGSDCYLCGLPIDLEAPRWTAKPGWEKGLHLDHLQRISEGGKDCLENVRPSHGLCNLTRH